MRVIVASCALGVASLLSNITSESELSGEAQVWFAVRRTISLVLNSGTVWAGISVLAGWWMRRHLAAAVAGLVAGPLALAVHYGLGELIGLMPAGSFASNLSWFVIAAVTGMPLGLVGALAHSARRWGLAARLVVPVGAVLEPLVLGSWVSHLPDSAAVRWSNLVAALLLTAAGLAGVLWAIRSRWRP